MTIAVIRFAEEPAMGAVLADIKQTIVALGRRLDATIVCSRARSSGLSR